MINIEVFDNTYSIYKIKLLMIEMGFDFSLSGSWNILEIMNDAVESCNNGILSCFPLSKIANRHCIKGKTIDRNVRWAITKAKNLVDLFSVEIDLLSTKDILEFMYKIFCKHI